MPRIRSSGGKGGEWTDTGTLLHPADLSGAEDVVVGGTTIAGSDIILGKEGYIIVNQQQADQDSQFKSVNDANLLYLDAGLNLVLIGTATARTLAPLTGKVGIETTDTDTGATFRSMITAISNANPAGDGTDKGALYFEQNTLEANTQDYDALRGIYGFVTHRGSGIVDDVFNFGGLVNNWSGTITRAHIHTAAVFNAGTIGTVYAFDALFVPAGIGNYYAFYSGDLSLATNAWAFYSKNGTVHFNDDGDDYDFTIEAVGVADAFVVQGSDGQITLGALGAGYVKSDAGGVLSVDAGPAAQNLFETIACPAGTNPVADTTTDTLTFANGTGISISGDASTDTVTITNSSPNVAQNLFETIACSSGTNPVADTTTDTLTLTAGAGITVTGDSATDTVTIANTAPNVAQNLFETINCPAGTDPVADTTTDTLNLAATGDLTITGDATTDTITIANTQSAVTLAGTPNYLTLSGQEITMTVLDISDDTNLAVTAPIVLTDDTLSLDLTANYTWTGTHEFNGASVSIASDTITVVDGADWTYSQYGTRGMSSNRLVVTSLGASGTTGNPTVWEIPIPWQLHGKAVTLRSVTFYYSMGLGDQIIRNLLYVHDVSAGTYTDIDNDAGVLSGTGSHSCSSLPRTFTADEHLMLTIVANVGMGGAVVIGGIIATFDND